MKQIVLTLLLLTATASAQIDWGDFVVDTANAGTFSISGVQHKSHWGWATGTGYYFPLVGDKLYAIIPGILQVGIGKEENEGMIHFSPQFGYAWKRFLVTAGPGLTNMWQNKTSTGYVEAEASVGFVIARDYKFKELEGKNRLVGELKQAAITLAVQYWPGSKEKAFILGLTILQ